MYMNCIRKFVACLPILFFVAESSAQNMDVDRDLKAIYEQPDDSARVELRYTYFRNIFYQGTSRESDIALPYAKRMLEETMRSQNPYRIAKAHHSLGYVYYPKRDYPASLFHANAAEKEWDATKNFRGLAEIKYLEGALYLSNNEMEKAL